MKRLSTILSFTWLALLMGSAGCEEESGINLNLTPTKTLSAPADGASVTLTPTTNASVVFEWEAAQADDGALVTYEVAFAQESGDFASPVYKVIADGNGVQNRATISHKTLNQIASYAGIASLSTGNVKWTVLASKGTNVKPADQIRTLQITRPAGFSDLPADVYLTGDATEAGSDVTNALRMRQTANGEYEIYTSLKAGTYAFVDRPTTNARTFSTDGQLIKEGGSTPVTGDSQVYRISLDFNNAAARLTRIEEVGLWIAAQNNVTVALPYTGGGTWKVENTPIEFFQFDWGRDERYKFRLKTNENGTEKTEWLGSANADNQRPDGTTPPAYFYLLPVPESQWDFTFKFNGDADGKNADIAVMLSPTQGNYTHEVTIR